LVYHFCYKEQEVGDLVTLCRLIIYGILRQTLRASVDHLNQAPRLMPECLQTTIIFNLENEVKNVRRDSKHDADDNPH